MLLCLTSDKRCTAGIYKKRFNRVRKWATSHASVISQTSSSLPLFYTDVMTSIKMEHRTSRAVAMEQSSSTWTSVNKSNTSNTTSLNILLAPQPCVTFYSPPNPPGLLDRLVSAESFSMVLFSYESFLHCLFISSERGLQTKRSFCCTIVS